MKTLNEIYLALSDLGALTKSSFTKAAKAAGHEKAKIDSFWIFSNPKVEKVTLTGAVREAILANPNLTDEEIIGELNQLGEDFGRTANPSWPQARSYFKDQWEIARSVYRKYTKETETETDENEAETETETEETETETETDENEENEAETETEETETDTETETDENEAETETETDENEAETETETDENEAETETDENETENETDETEG